VRSAAACTGGDNKGAVQAAAMGIAVRESGVNAAMVPVSEVQTYACFLQPG